MNKNIRSIFVSTLLSILLLAITSCSYADETSSKDPSMDRIELATQQINLLKNRLAQGEQELAQLQRHDKNIPKLTITNTNKNLLEKASLDISVAKSNLDTLNIELTDCQQTISWLQKSIQEIENQLNVSSIFGIKATQHDVINVNELHTDLVYQRKLLNLEKIRNKYLQDLQSTANNIWNSKNENYNYIINLLKSRNLLHIKQKQAKDELAYENQQNYWLSQLNHLYARLSTIDPTVDKEGYAALERDIFYTNENASYAYVQSLLARYKDQIEQMRLSILKSNSIALLNEMNDQVDALNKQIARLKEVVSTRAKVLDKHVTYLSVKLKSNKSNGLQNYVNHLVELKDQYTDAIDALSHIAKDLADFKVTLDKALQALPSFAAKTWVGIGGEIALVPQLGFDIVKSLSSHVAQSAKNMNLWLWTFFASIEITSLFIFFFLRQFLKRKLNSPSSWREKLNSKWLSLQWLYRNAFDLFIISNSLFALYFFSVPVQNFIFMLYLSFVWLIFKSIMVIARLCLVETTHDTTGHDMRLYRRLKWIFWAGGLISAFTVFTHLLPAIYELKILSDRLFLFFLMVVSILLLRSWHVLPHLILSHMVENRHPYLQNSVRLIGILIPVLMFGNAVIGLFGFVNLIMTVSWYEGIFLIVLIGYLMLRGLLSDTMQLCYRLTIEYFNNGWLLTEALLKPLDKILRIALFFSSVAVLFMLYGWNAQSSVVMHIKQLLHYELVHVANTIITPFNLIALFVVMSLSYWTAKWTREFVYRMLLSRTQDLGLRNSVAILSQYSVICSGILICLRVLGIDLHALTVVAGMFAFGVGLGLRDLANNFACGFLILIERPLRVGDIVEISGVEGEVKHIGSRAVLVNTWDNMELIVPNAEIFNKSFINWTAKDNIVRCISIIKISRHDDPHFVETLIKNILQNHKDILSHPRHEVFLKDISDALMTFELRYFVNIREVSSRMSVMSTVLMTIWDEFSSHGIKPPYPQHELLLREEGSTLAYPMPHVLQDAKL